MAAIGLKATDRKAMRDATMACWWTDRAFPKNRPVWSGIRGELEAMALGAEYRDDAIEARELMRLAHEAERLQNVDF